MAAAISLGAPEWAHGAANVEAIGAVETGVAVTGTAVTGVVAIGMAAIGTTGMVIGTIIVAIMSSSSVTSASHGGGVGAGVRRGAGAIRTGTDIMVLATRTPGTAMDTTAATGTDTATQATVMDTATAAGPEWPSCSAGSLAPAITAGPLTASWDRRRVEQFGLTSAIAETQADQVSFAYRRDDLVDFRFIDRRNSQGGRGGRAAGRSIL
jgi:hypothetical protein